MDRTVGRTVSALVTTNDEYLGTIGPFAVESHWWADVEPVVAHVGQVLGVPVVVLRLVGVDGGTNPRGGHVTYHVDVLGRPPDGLLSTRSPGDLLQPAAKRAEWATASGVREALGWADTELRALGRPATGEMEQVKTWNLSGLFRIPTRQGPVWLKATPEFATCEASAIGAFARVDPEFVPTVVAADLVRKWVLLEHVPGEDGLDAPADVLRTTMSRLISAQAEIAERWPEVRDGLPDRTPRALVDRVRELLDGEVAEDLSAEELSAARRLAVRLPALVASLEACGLPNTMVHGDFHPGNWKSDGQSTVMFDFADSHFGHPVLDGLRLCEFLPEERRPPVADAWIKAWSVRIPGSDPARALAIAGPLAHLSYAVRYQEFLDNIELSEHVYHEGDPAHAVREALASAELMDASGWY